MPSCISTQVVLPWALKLRYASASRCENLYKYLKDNWHYGEAGIEIRGPKDTDFQRNFDGFSTSSTSSVFSGSVRSLQVIRLQINRIQKHETKRAAREQGLCAFAYTNIRSGEWPIRYTSPKIPEVLLCAPGTVQPLEGTRISNHTRTLLPSALASVSFGFVLVQVRLLDSLSKKVRCGSLLIGWGFLFFA